MINIQYAFFLFKNFNISEILFLKYFFMILASVLTGRLALVGINQLTTYIGYLVDGLG